MLATLLLKLSPVGAILKAVPRWAWIALAAVALLVGGYLWHQHKLHQHDAALVKATIAAEDARIEKRALALKARIDALTGKISTTLKEKNREENDHSARVADDVLVHGPGKAVCPGVTSLPGASGGHIPPAGPANAGLAPVLDQERQQFIALPFAPTVGFAKGHDQCQADLRAYREWGDQIMKVWPKPTAK